MKKTKMLSVLVLTVLCLCFGFGARAVRAAESEVKVTIHYHRFDGSYSGWNLWLWPDGGNGAAYQFDEGTDDYGKSLTYIAEAGSADMLGIIVRLNDWKAKDIDADRFIDLTKAENGVLDVYLLESDAVIHYDAAEVDLSPKFLNAAVRKDGSVYYKTTEPFTLSREGDKDKYKITDEEGTVYSITDIRSAGGGIPVSAVITTAEPMTAAHSYVLSHEKFGSIPIQLSGLFDTEEFSLNYYYEGDDLGAVYSPEATAFKLWAPTADSVMLELYEDGDSDSLTASMPMDKGEKGVFSLQVTGDLKNVYYVYRLSFGSETREACDPYARTTGLNGRRAMVIDLKETDPAGWDKDTAPAMENATDTVLYELHVRDLSVDPSSGISNKGKYLAFTETGTVNADGMSTGIDHLKELGVTHVHLMPSYDYASVDETDPDHQFNWGYDPQNYNVPEGSYSTDPYHGEVRVNEFKQMVQSLHSNGMRVVMDVVYNHTFNTDTSPFGNTVPGYFYRMDGDNYLNGSGCGNEVASERVMVRKYIIDSVKYWAKEYHIDGFRFDLMGLIDIETMNEIRAELDKIDPSIIIYGEGWNAGSCGLENGDAALKANAKLLDSGIAMFSDDMRDGLKGSVFSDSAKGFVSGQNGKTERIKFGITAATGASGIDFEKVDSASEAWAGEPTQCINYSACHDNNTLWDKLAISNPDDTIANRKRMYRLSAAIVLSSQGTPFLLSGEEMLRSKPDSASSTGFSSNSYNSSDAVNSLKWDELTANRDIFEYYKGLIAFRKEHKALRLTKTADIDKYLSFIDVPSENLIAYLIDGAADGENGRDICVIFNAEREAQTLSIPTGTWNIYVDGQTAGTQSLRQSGSSIEIEPLSALILIKESDSEPAAESTEPVKDETIQEEDKNSAAVPESNDNNSAAKEETESHKGGIAAAIAAAVAVIAGAVAFIFKRSKKK